MDNKHISLLTLCDLSKAFDSVNHKTLLHRLSKVNIDVFWFKDYICSRTLTVRLQNRLSAKTELHYGVPQGSIVGPILFTLNVNDMHEHFDGCTLIQFADDTQFLHSGPRKDLNLLVQRVETTLSGAMVYFNKNGLMLNTQKTQCIFIGSKQL